MDDMRNTSAPLYGKAEPATTKTTMSVREMRQLLGRGHCGVQGCGRL